MSADVLYKLPAPRGRRKYASSNGKIHNTRAKIPAHPSNAALPPSPNLGRNQINYGNSEPLSLVATRS